MSVSLRWLQRRGWLVVAIAVATAAACAPAPAVPSGSPSATPSSTAAVAPSATASPAQSTPSLSAAPPAFHAFLDGVASESGVGDRLPVAVMIDNNLAARPQYGFNAASIVYQAPADGGEDRYMFVYQEQDAERVQPVRSGRPYFVNWATEYGAAFAHYGGDLKTRTYLPTVDRGPLWDVDALNGSPGPFRRDPTMRAPHNAYTSTAKVRARAVDRGAPPTMSAEAIAATMRAFAADLPPGDRSSRGSISVPYPRGSADYTYDHATNSYLRSVAGVPQVDAADGARVIARNVVVLFMKLSVDPESEPGHRRPLLGHLGTGPALVFRDGRVIEGTWSKPSAHALTRFLDVGGQEITLVRGPIYIQVVPTGTKVTYDAPA